MFLSPSRQSKNRTPFIFNSVKNPPAPVGEGVTLFTDVAGMGENNSNFSCGGHVSTHSGNSDERGSNRWRRRSVLSGTFYCANAKKRFRAANEGQSEVARDVCWKQRFQLLKVERSYVNSYHVSTTSYIISVSGGHISWSTAVENYHLSVCKYG